MTGRHGEGSVYHRTSDGRWCAVIPPSKSGAARPITLTGATEKEARDRRDARMRDIIRNGPPSASVAERTTVQTWAKKWLERQEARVRPNTFTGYRTAVNLWIVPAIGARRLSVLAPSDVRRVTDAVIDAGRSSTTAKLQQTILIKMLRDARRDGYHVPERVFGMDAPAKAHHDRQAIPVADCLKLLRAAKATPMYARWIVAFLYGLREGQVLGLEWDRVDDLALDATMQLQYIRNGATLPHGYKARRLTGNYWIVPAKTKSSARVFPMLPHLYAALPEAGTGLVFTLDGHPVGDKQDTQAWRALQDTANVRHPAGRYYKIHEIRHSTATLLMALGVPIEVRMAILGHSVMETTMDYSHSDLVLMRDALDKAAERLELG
jgi:integrase